MLARAGEGFQRPRDGLGAAHFLRADRGFEGAAGGGRRRSHLRHRVRDLLRGGRAVRGARQRAGLVLRDRAEARVFSVRQLGLVPRARGDPAGHQGHSSEGERALGQTTHQTKYIYIQNAYM